VRTENDEETVQPIRLLNWLECKKAEKARLIAMPSEREKLTEGLGKSLTEELGKSLAEPNKAEDSTVILMCGGRPTRHHIYGMAQIYGGFKFLNFYF
jgi:hypothetical protein